MPELDKKRTKKAVEKAFEKYRTYKYLGFEAREPILTASPEPRWHGPTNKISDQTSSVASYNVDEPEKRRRYCEEIEQAVAELPEKEAFLIRERYMTRDADYLTDYAVYMHRFDPPIHPETYHKIRWSAFEKLALRLGLAVYVKGGGDDAENRTGGGAYIETG